MKRTFAEELKATDIGVIATTNNQDGVEVWINARKGANIEGFQEARAALLQHHFEEWSPEYREPDESEDQTHPS